MLGDFMIKKVIIFFLIVLSVLLLFGCIETEESKNNLINENVSFSFDEEKQEVSYSIDLEAPRSCDTFEVSNILIQESYPVQVQIILKPLFPDMMCAEVITPVTISGSIPLDHMPGSISYKIEDVGEDTPRIIDDNSEKHFCSVEQKEAVICYTLYAPVCGSDGVTYGNDCVACSAGVESYVMGEC
jgi:hypothetical protein